MSEHKFPRDRINRVPEIIKPVHPFGWSCMNCTHVVKDPNPGSNQMKCVRYPPIPQMVIANGQQATLNMSPGVTADDWCGEYNQINPGAGLMPA